MAHAANRRVHLFYMLRFLPLSEAVRQKQYHAGPHEGEHDAVDSGEGFPHDEDAEEELDGGVDVH